MQLHQSSFAGEGWQEWKGSPQANPGSMANNVFIYLFKNGLQYAEGCLVALLAGCRAIQWIIHRPSGDVSKCIKAGAVTPKHHRFVTWCHTLVCKSASSSKMV